MTAISSQIRSYLEREKSSSQIFGPIKKRMTAISSHKNCFAAIWSPEKVVHNSLEQEKRTTAICSHKNWFTAIWSMKTMGLGYLESENTRSHLFKARKK